MKDNFEWGANGDHIHDSGGGVTWTTSATPPVISTDRAYSGTRSAKWSGSASQYIQCAKPAGYGYDIHVRYYKPTGGGTLRPIQHGNATHRFRIMVLGTGRIGAYADGVPINYYNLHSLDAWHKLSVKDINWAAATYSIYVDDLLEAAGCPMEVSGAINNLYQGTTEDSTSGIPFYLDDFDIGKYVGGGNAARLVAARLI